MKERTTLQPATAAARRLLQAALCVLIATSAYGDFYRYVGEDGVEVFTNTPMKGSVRVLRETAGRKSVAKYERKHSTAYEPSVPTAPPVPSVSSLPSSSTQDLLLPVKGVVTSKVGWRHDPIDGVIRHHNGVDIAVPAGTRVKAIAAGRVVESAMHGGYGNLVTIEHADGMISMYGHNSQLNVKAGDVVAAGETVALSGSTGRSTGPHLHFELWKHGVNVTEAYLNNGAGVPDTTGSIRSYVHKDGSIVFTNLAQPSH